MECDQWDQKHIEGMCGHTAQGCNSGQHCTFCHLPHVQPCNRSSNRPCRSKRPHCKTFLSLIADIAEGGNNVQVLQVAHNVACQSPYMQGMLQKHVQLPGRDQQPVPCDEHNPTVEAGSE